MPTDKEIKQLVLNVLTEEQYASIAKKEDEIYLTPDDSDEIKKLIPTDIDIKDNKLGLSTPPGNKYICDKSEPEAKINGVCFGAYIATSPEKLDIAVLN